MQRRQFIARGLITTSSAASAALCTTGARAQSSAAWAEVLAQARGQTVYWNAWAGDEKTNDFIAWVGAQATARHSVAVQHVRLKDTAEAVARVVAEKAAGRTRDGSVDLVWINGPNLLTLKREGLLHGPVDQLLPNHQWVDRRNKPSNLTDFGTPVDGMAVPWRLAQLVFIHDGARLGAADVPRSAPALLDWARRHPGRVTHPNVANFMGASFLKQALLDLSTDTAVLQQSATDDNFERSTAPLWAWYSALRPLLWRRGQQFPENEAAQRQLLGDGEIDISLSFNPLEAAVAVQAGLLPATVRTSTWAKGTLGNTSFVAIPANARARQGALVVANLLLDPATQARAQDIRHLGSLSVLDQARLPAELRALFTGSGNHPSLPAGNDFGAVQLEPHASWMTRISAEWQKRTVR